MFYFAFGFLTAWVAIAVFLMVADNKNGTGIQLFDGWGVTLILLPILVVLYPVVFLIKIFKKLLDKIKRV